MAEIILIAAKTRNHVIGKAGEMPWHLPADLKHFKAITTGYPIIMGRKTYDTLGKALPDRENHVISRQITQYPDAYAHTSLQAAIDACQNAEKVFVIGGGQIYQEAMPMVDKLLLTEIDTELEGDTFFPDINPKVWEESHREVLPADEKNAYDLAFVYYYRK